MPNLWVRKSIDALKAEAAVSDAHHGLKRTLTASNLVMLGIGAIIGAGFFVLTGHAAAENAGPAISISFVLGGIVCAFAGLCYAEMASTVPIAGSAYTYAYATMGEFIAWLIGWDLILEYMVGATTVAIGWSGYVTSVLHGWGIEVPPEFIAAPGTLLVQVPDQVAELLHMRHGWTPLTSQIQELFKTHQAEILGLGLDADKFNQVTAVLNVPAMLVVVLVSSLLVIGVRESATVNNIIVIIKVAIVLIFILLGLRYIDLNNWGGEFIPSNSGKFGEYGWSGIFRGAGLVFFAYIGFDAVSTTAQEAKNPQRDLPIGIIGSLVICTLLYCIAAFVMTGVVNYRQLNVPDPVAVAIDQMRGQSWLAPYVKLGAIAGLTSVILVMLMSQPRIFYSMAKDGLLPRAVSKIHPKFRTPWITTIITGLVVMIAAGTVPIDVAGELTSIGTLFAFAVVSAGVFYLRLTQPNVERPFKAPFVYFTAPMGVITSVFLMATLPLDTWIRLVVWMVIGLVLYFVYGASHSVLGNPDKVKAPSIAEDAIV
jgi:APA family basic amino acid/polyamine antiporter